MAGAEKKAKRAEKRRLGPVGAAALMVLGLLACAALIHLAGRSGPAPEPEEEPERSDTVLVNDGVHYVEIQPEESLPVNARSASDFTAEGDVISCAGARQGIDVSEYQEEIDWQQVAESGVSFVFVRLGYRGATEGGLFADRRWEQHLQGAAAAGLDVGVYFFSQALDSAEAAEEAAWALELLDGTPLTLPVMFDWETVNIEGGRTAGAEREALTERTAAFCRTVAAGGYDAGVYFNRQYGYYNYELSALADYLFWISDPNPWPDFYYDFGVWQYTYEGSVPGISVPVDRNLMFGK